MLVLGIETSCDETAAAVVRDGREIVSSVISSQIPIHKRFGGVVPELASREHLDKIVPVVSEAFERAGLTASDLDGIAVTVGPGLVGSLLGGVSYAKAMAYALGKPFVGVNHIEGHIYSVAFENPPIEYPAEALIVSGGHTNIFFIPEPGKYKVVARARDDAAGEAFDKVAKLLGLGYPGGPIIDKLSTHGDPTAVSFPPAQLKHRDRRDVKERDVKEKDPGERAVEPRFDFSDSGIKTAVLRYVEVHDMKASIEARRKALADMAKPNLDDYLRHCDRKTLNLVASFQRALIGDLVTKTLAAARACNTATLFVTGGVAANNELRQRFEHAAAMDGLPVYFPSRPLSTDNAAMIAAAAYPKFLAREFAAMDFSAEAGMALR